MVNLPPQSSSSDKSYDELATKIQAATNDVERRIRELTNNIAAMEAGDRDPALFPLSSALRADNNKLKFRARILKRSTEEEKAKKPREEDEDETEPNSVLGVVENLFRQAILAAYPQLSGEQLPPIQVSETAKAQFGDYQCNNAMQLAQILNKAGTKTNPRQVAEAIKANFPTSDMVEKLEIAGPGFINLFLSRNRLSEMIASFLLDGIKPPKTKKKRVMVDFSSPNIAKEMHVGHLRSTIIGDSICRLLEWVGWDVLRISHLGDWGTQFGMLIAHLQDKFPNYKTEVPPIGHLQTFYKESKKRFDDDEVFKKRAYECVVKLQNHDLDFIQAWNQICDVSRQDFGRIYERLDIKVKERGESFYQDLMVKRVDEYKKLGLLTEQDGRMLMWVKEKPEIPLTIVKSDGGFTYDTSDMAAIHHRLFDENCDWILYVVDAGQNTHLEMIYAAARALGYYEPSEKRVEHITFGLVLGEDKKKFKTRSGDTVRLTDLLDEGVKRAEDKLIEKGRDKELTKEEFRKAADAVAYGCIKYADLSHNRQADYIFSFDRMLDDRGNTAVYLLYALTRIRSIARNAGVKRDQLKEYLSKINHSSEPLYQTPEELKLAKHILRFPDVINSLLDRIMLHVLAEYLYELSTKFSDFYSVCYCIEKDKESGAVKKIHYNRLVLCETVGDVMDLGFHILGIQTLERM